MEEIFKAKLEKYYQYKYISLSNTTKEFLLEFLDLVEDLRDTNMRMSPFRDFGIYSPYNPYGDEIENINEKLTDLYSPKGFKIPIVINKGDVIHGHKIIMNIIEDENKKHISLPLYEEIKEKWDMPNGKLDNYDTFHDEFREVACSEWSKSDVKGESYGGYWKYPEDSEEYKNAYFLTFEENCSFI